MAVSTVVFDLLILLVLGPQTPAPPPFPFVDVTARAGIDRRAATYDAIAADVDGDGDYDVFVATHGDQPAFYINRGDGTFVDRAGDWIIFSPPGSDWHGSGFVDVNGDGLADIIITSGAARGEGSGPNQVVFNLGGKGFSKMQQLPEPLADAAGRHRSVLCRDFDLNGLTDVLFLNYHSSNRLLLAGRDRAFRESPGQQSLDGCDIVTGTLVHIDQDQLLDLVGVQLERYTPKIMLGNVEGGFTVSPDLAPFKDITQTSSIEVGDVDNDGDLDLYVSQGRRLLEAVAVEGDKICFGLVGRGKAPKGFRFPIAEVQSVTLDLRVNSNTQRRFVGPRGQEAPKGVMHWTKAELAQIGPRATDASLGFGDYISVDEQQRFTLEFVSQPGTDSDTNGILTAPGLRPESVETFGPLQTKLPDMVNRLLLNDGTGKFRDVTAESGAGEARSTRQSVLADFDNDGDLDIFVLNDAPLLRDQPDAIYWNDGAAHFTRADSPLPVLPMGGGLPSSVLAFDYDGDGDLDLFITNGAGNPPLDVGPFQLLQNQSVGGHWLVVRLEGKQSNPFGLGSRVFAELADGRKLMREVTGGNTFYSQSLLPVHFGLGSSSVVRLRVIWPDGHEQVLSRIPIDRTIVVKEGVDELEDAPARAGPGLVTYVIAWVAAAVVVAFVLRAWRRARAR